MHPVEIGYWTLGGVAVISTGFTLWAWPAIWIVGMVMLFWPRTSNGPH